VQNLTGGVTAVAVGIGHTCAVVNGGVWCWGLNDHGQLGNAAATETWVPMAVPTLSSGVKAISCGRTHTCAVVDSGVKCWGNNASGQLGNNSTGDSSTPVLVQAL
jgi:alpha-tubulin suppressor-like RCC1 family protein